MHTAIPFDVPDLLDWSMASEAERATALQRPPIPCGDFQTAVATIISRVRKDGDRALRELGEKYDGVRVESQALYLFQKLTHITIDHIDHRSIIFFHLWPILF